MPACNLLVLGSKKTTLSGFSQTATLPHTGFIYYSDIVQDTSSVWFSKTINFHFYSNEIQLILFFIFVGFEKKSSEARSSKKHVGREGWRLSREHGRSHRTIVTRRNWKETGQDARTTASQVYQASAQTSGPWQEEAWWQTRSKDEGTLCHHRVPKARQQIEFRRRKNCFFNIVCFYL